MNVVGQNKEIAVIGAGGWGTALALLLSRKGYRVRLWVYEPELVDIIEKTQQNAYFLQGYDLPDMIVPSNSLQDVIENRDFIVLVTPSQIGRAHV